MANTSETHKRILKQPQSMMASSFNIRELLRKTTHLLVGNRKD